jgi:hypothetical protein
MAVDISPGAALVYPGYQTQWGLEQYLFSAQGNDLEHGRKADKIAGDGFGARVRNSLPGMMDGSLKIKGLATMDKGTLNWQLNQWMGRRSPVNAWFALEGLTALSPITMQPSSIIDNSVTAKLKDAVDFSLELDARGAFDDGIILLSPQDLLVGASGTGSTDLNANFGGATTTGCVGQLHVWALDGGTTPAVTVKIQHSPDGTTWTDLVTFPAMSAAGSKRIKLSSTTTVNSYIQAVWTATGTPTDVQVLLGFARGINLNV